MHKIMDMCIILNTIRPYLRIHTPRRSDTTIKECTATHRPHLILHIPMVLGLAQFLNLVVLQRWRLEAKWNTNSARYCQRCRYS